jgi:hypothetical protein
MPLLVRAARLTDVPPGGSITVKVRTESLFRGKRLQVVLENDGTSVRATDPKGGGTYRVVLKGDYVWIAVDRDRESAPASLQATSRAPDRVS